MIPITEKVSQLQLPQNLASIQQFSFAFSNSFLILITTDPRLSKYSHSQSELLHLDESHGILHRISFEQNITRFSILQEGLVLILLAIRNQLLVVNLRDKSEKRVKFYFQTKADKQLDIYSFSQTSLFCIRETAILEQKVIDYNRPKFIVFKLTYLPPTLQISSHLKYELKVKKTEFLDSYPSYKGNNHSLVLIFLSDGQFNLCMIKVNNQKSMMIIKIKIVDQNWSNNYVVSAYQTKHKDIVLITVHLGLYSNQYQIKLFNPDTQSLRCLNYQLNSQDKLDKKVLFINNVIILKTIDNINLFSTLTYFDIERDQVVFCQKEMKLSDQLLEIKFEEDEIMAQGVFDKHDKVFKVSEKTMHSLKFIHLDFLLHINDDFDDDLLLDAIRIL